MNQKFHRNFRGFGSFNPTVLLSTLAILITAGCSDDSSLEAGSFSADGDYIGSEEPDHNEITPGTLTAGVWDDNQNFGYYLEYLAREDDQQLSGLPVIPRLDRMLVLITDQAGNSLPGARVALHGELRALDASTTGADGRVLFFPAARGAEQQEELTIIVEYEGSSFDTTVPFGTEEVELAIPAQTPTPIQALDLALIIDTTGSMGDEIRYLTVEIDSIVATVRAQYPDLQQRFGLVLYRDDGDDYVTRSFEFTSNLQEFQTNLAAQSANGGGDYPEALERGLQAGVNLAWRGGQVARVAFLIADAPHHAGKEQQVLDAIWGARDKGIRLYPVAASGADSLTEYTMRTMAQVTGGRYLFLTDDSGVGDSHLEPSIPCYHVTRFDQAMIRMIAIEVSGHYIPVDPVDVIRTGGNPQDGICALEDDSQLAVY